MRLVPTTTRPQRKRRIATKFSGAATFTAAERNGVGDNVLLSRVAAKRKANMPGSERVLRAMNANDRCAASGSVFACVRAFGFQSVTDRPGDAYSHKIRHVRMNAATVFCNQWRCDRRNYAYRKHGCRFEVLGLPFARCDATRDFWNVNKIIRRIIFVWCATPPSHCRCQGSCDWREPDATTFNACRSGGGNTLPRFSARRRMPAHAFWLK